MRILMLLTVAVLQSAAMAAPATNSLVVPVYVIDSAQQVGPLPVLDYNKRLREASRPEIPLTVVFNGDHQTDAATIQTLNEAVINAAANLGLKTESLKLSTEAVPNEHVDATEKTAKTCYTGEAAAVQSIVASLAGSYYSEKMQIFAARFRQEIWVDPQQQKPVDLQKIKEWREHNTTSDAVLLLAHTTDDREDVRPALIDKCR